MLKITVFLRFNRVRAMRYVNGMNVRGKEKIFFDLFAAELAEGIDFPDTLLKLTLKVIALLLLKRKYRLKLRK